MDKNSLEGLTPEALDRATVLHPNTPYQAHFDGSMGDPRIIRSGQGVYVSDSKGKDYLDAFAGLYCVNVGYGRTEIAEAIYKQAKKLAYYHTYVGHSSDLLVALSKRIIEWAPAGMSKVYYGTSGSDANETNVKFVWYYWRVRGEPRRRKIIARDRAYHGSGIFTGSMTGLPLWHATFGLPVAEVKHTVAPHYYWEAQEGMSETEFSGFCADQLEQLILEEGPETIAAFIGEPLLGTGGIVPPPHGYWKRIQKVLNEYDILLIADEVITGFGRMGTRFGCDYYGIEPDLMTCAKGLTSGYFPLSASIINEEVWETLAKGTEQYGPMGHGWTYSGHPLGLAAAMANLDIIEQDNLMENTINSGAYLQRCLRKAFEDHPFIGEVRGENLLVGVEFVADKQKKLRFDAGGAVGARVAKNCLDKGLIVRAMPHQDTLGMAPPLSISQPEIDRMVEILHLAVAESF